MTRLAQCVLLPCPRQLSSPWCRVITTRRLWCERPLPPRSPKRLASAVTCESRTVIRILGSLALLVPAVHLVTMWVPLLMATDTGALRWKGPRCRLGRCLVWVSGGTLLGDLDWWIVGVHRECDWKVNFSLFGGYGLGLCYCNARGGKVVGC